MNVVYVPVMGHTRTFLGASRALVGLSAWAAPDVAVKAFGLDPARSDRFVTRLFGARDLALGVSLLAADARHLRAAAGVAVVIDTVDTIAGLDEHRRGNLSTWALISGAGGAAMFAVLGLLVLREEGAAAP